MKIQHTLTGLGFCLLITALAITSSKATAEELRYRPVNPSFGGNPLNGSYLLGSATTQRKFEQSREQRNPVEEFSQNIQRSILSLVSRQIADSILGEEARDSGSFNVGNLSIDFQRDGETVTVNINDADTGGTTTLEIPAPVF